MNVGRIRGWSVHMQYGMTEVIPRSDKEEQDGEEDELKG
jgi:hypothetical protein